MTTTLMDADKNIHCISGDPFELHLFNINEDGETIDFSNWTIHLRAFNANGNTPIVEFDNSDVDATTPGVLIFKKTAENSKFPIGTYHYDWKMGKPGKELVTWINNHLFFVE